MRARQVLPGFALSLGYTVFYLSVLVLLPLAALVARAAALSGEDFWAAAWDARARAAYTLSCLASLAAAALSSVLGVFIAWVLVRYDFPLRRWWDALVDLPFALPTAVTGLVFASLYAPHGWLGRFLTPLGIRGAYSRLGIVLVLTFTGLPFVVRTVQPVLHSLEVEIVEAAVTLGANSRQVFWRVLWPLLRPAVFTGFTLAFARCLGEYGSVVFIAGNLPFYTEIAPVLIVARLEEFAYGQAAAIAVVLLGLSGLLLVLINLLARWSRNHA